MRQALHIFKKDVRHLWFEIAVAILVAAAFTFTGARRAQWLVAPETNRIAAWSLEMILLPLAWWALIARAIHDEALPGDRQFWITRPCSWKSLLGAKVLFILAFINLPMLVADAVIVSAYGLPLRAEWAGLLWSQVVLTIVFILPMVVLSALTTGFVQLIFAVLVPCLVALAVAIVAPGAVLRGFLGGSDWVRFYYAYAVIACAAPAIVVWQYLRRGTTAGRAFAVTAGMLVVAGIALIPWPAAFRIQSLLSKQRIDQSVARVDFDSGNKWLTRVVAEDEDRVRIDLPLKITELPSGLSAKPEGFSLRLETPDGATWEGGQLPLKYASKSDQEFSLEAAVDGAFYNKAKGEPLKVRGSLYMTLFGNRQATRVAVGGRSVPVPRVGVCSADRVINRHNYFLICTSAFRFPAALVFYDFLRSANDDVAQMWSATQPRAISYSPFPADAGISPVSQDFTFSGARAPLTEASVSTVEALAYIRRNFQIDNLRLSDFEVRPTKNSP